MDALKNGLKSFKVDESRKSVDEITTYKELLKTPLHVSTYEYKLHDSASYFDIGQNSVHNIASMSSNGIEHCEGSKGVKAGDFYLASHDSSFLSNKQFASHAHTKNGIVFSRIVESVEQQPGAKCARVVTRAIHPAEMLSSFHVHTGNSILSLLLSLLLCVACFHLFKRILITAFLFVL